MVLTVGTKVVNMKQKYNMIPRQINYGANAKRFTHNVKNLIVNSAYVTLKAMFLGYGDSLLFFCLLFMGTRLDQPGSVVSRHVRAKEACVQRRKL